MNRRKFIANAAAMALVPCLLSSHQTVAKTQETIHAVTPKIQIHITSRDVIENGVKVGQEVVSRKIIFDSKEISDDELYRLQGVRLR